MAILIKTAAEIEKMRRSGEALHQVHEAVRPFVVPGASTMDLEKVAAAKMDELHAISAFKGYRGFPAVLCTSINDEVVHGIPSATRILAEGDIVSVDCGVIVDGFYSDSAVTYAVGTPSAATKKLLDVTQARWSGRSSRHGSVGAWATSPQQCRRCARARATASFASLSATGSANPCTKTHRCPTTARAAKGRG